MTITTENVARQQRINRVERVLLDIGFCANSIRVKADPERCKGWFSKVYPGPTGTLDVMRENIAHFKSSFSADSLKKADKDLCTVAALMQRNESRYWLKAADILDGIESYLRLSLSSPMHDIEPKEPVSPQRPSAKLPGKEPGKKAKRPGVNAAVYAAIEKNSGKPMTIREMAEATGYVQGTISPCKAWQEAKRIWGQEAESHLLQKYGNRVVDNQDFKGAASVVRRTIRAPDKRRGAHWCQKLNRRRND